MKANSAITWPGGSIIADPTLTLAFLEHEYGHYLDELKNGSLYYIFEVMPSSGFNMQFYPDTHANYWTEIRANINAVQFFGPDSAIANDPGRFPTNPSQ
ncbi:hypothetical protein [Mucilaginibacter frigoritolerans]|uniref:hypothetical protein n=1 Tax=Mucilaginibacter frigoritolerans TaxID=652788 RepID=UPI0011A83E0E|nr:hypothetical protein [Mucilaginibacter frigoritolerans]